MKTNFGDYFKSIMSDNFAFLFDMDGTMVDNMKYHELAWQQQLKQLGKDLSSEEIKPTLYGKNEEVLQRHFGDRFSDEDVELFSKQKEEKYQTLYKDHISLIKGLPSFLQQAYDAHIALAIATASASSNIEMILKATHSHKFFNVIITAEQTKKGKPDPEVFLTAASQLNISPQLCIVFEDSLKGAEAAYNGGMRSVFITTSGQESDLKRLPGVIKIIDDFSSISPDSIISILQE
ncbi:MAG: HAD family phosphatase [Chitinophagales bacterium]|nr:HAD family phosphatase [Chitinophagales bacterium]